MQQLALPIARRGAKDNFAAVPAVSQSLETVIFLDIDGVLHSLYGDDLFRDGCCSLLRQIIQATGADMVLSSSWRTEPGKVAVLNGVLRQWQLPLAVDRTKELDVSREAEICEWLDRHPQVVRWIAIDDMDLQAGHTPHSLRMRGHFVRTNPQTGLTAQDAELAIQLLLSHSVARTPAFRSPTAQSSMAQGSASPSSAALWRSPSSWSLVVAQNRLPRSPRTPVTADFHTPSSSPIHRVIVACPDCISTSSFLGARASQLGAAGARTPQQVSMFAQKDFWCDDPGAQVRRNSMPLLIGSPSGQVTSPGSAHDSPVFYGFSLDANGCSPCRGNSATTLGDFSGQSPPRSPLACGLEVAGRRRRATFSFNPPAF